jgi:phospholipid/cholesterol/gamma-HCH transport system substrate-binding protein
MEIAPEFAPISSDAKAILRQKTLLGETYVELTAGTEPGQEAAPVSLGAAGGASDAQASGAEAVPEGGTLGLGQTVEATQIDEIFNALDEETRSSFQRWMSNAAIGIRDRGLDLSDSFGNLGPFLVDATAVVETLNSQKQALKGLVRDTGTVFEAITARDQDLAGAIVGTHDTFEALASEERALSRSFQILPTFERESRLTFERLDRFQADTRPLIADLIPVARDLSPTLRSVRRLSPSLLALFHDLDRLVEASKEGLPALRDVLAGLGPLFDELDPFLANLNPVLRYLEFQKHTVADFLVAPGVGTSGIVDPDSFPGISDDDPAPRHTLRVLSYLSAETLSIHNARLSTNRGNGYLAPFGITNAISASNGIFANFDCKNLDYTPLTTVLSPEAMDEEDPHTLADPHPNAAQPVGFTSFPGGTGNFAPCYVPQGSGADDPNTFLDDSNPFADFGGGRFPQVFADP